MPHAHLCVYGLYAPMNQKLLRGLGVKTILGGEFEPGLVSLAHRLRAGEACDVQIEPVVNLRQGRVHDARSLRPAAASNATPI